MSRTPAGTGRGSPTRADSTPAGEPPATGGSQRITVGRRAVLLAGCLLVGVGVTVAVLYAADSVPAELVPGLGDPGPVTGWALPLSALVGRLAAVATVGLLIAAAFFTPGLAVTGRAGGRTLGPTGYRWLRAASWAALAWLAATAAQVVFTLSDLLGVPPGVAFGELRWSFELESTRALLLVMTGAAVLTIGAATALTTTGTAWLAVLAVATTLPPAFTGHAAAAGNHQLAVDSLIWHIAAAAIWAGGLLALLVGRRDAGLPAAARRHSRAAAWCFVIVAASGTVNALGRIDLGDIAATDYGRAILGKLLALLVLGGLGLWNRKVSLVRLDAGQPAAFRRFAAGELFVFAGTFGLAAALSRLPDPGEPVARSTAQALLGYPPPDGPPTPRSVFLEWLPEPLFLGISLIAVLLYAAGTRRLWRSGTRWPWLRLVSWCAGWAVVVFATNSGLAAYAPLRFSVHMAQHLALMTLAPVFMVLGAPVTLALRTLRLTTEPGMRGPREWLRLALHSRLTRLLAHPVVALVVLVVSLFGMYFTGLYEVALRSHLAHLAMLAHLLAAGYLFYWSVVGVDPTPHRVPPPVRMLVLFAAMGFHAFFGVALMQSGVATAADWYAALDLPWLGDPVADQRTAGGIAWSFGEIPSLVVAIALLVQWLRVDEREARRYDRAAARAAATGDTSLDPYEAYNAYLKRLAEADRAAGHRPEG
jgi:putative copper resistance protein D